MEIPILKCRRQLRAGACDEVEKPFTLAYCAVREPNDWGGARDDSRNALPG